MLKRKPHKVQYCAFRSYLKTVDCHEACLDEVITAAELGLSTAIKSDLK